MLKGADMVFVTAGEGGGTGTGGAPVVANVARSLGALTIGVVTRPFGFEGKRRAARPRTASSGCASEVDTLIVIPNDRLLSISDRHVSVLDAFKAADQVLLSGVQGITDLITTPGLINLDFADVKSVMSGAGLGADGHRLGARRRPRRGRRRDGDLQPAARGQHRRRARRAAVHPGRFGPRPVRDQRGRPAGRQSAAPDANIIFGAVIDDALGDEVRVTVIAAGFDENQMAPDLAAAGGRSATARSAPRAPDPALGAPAGNPRDQAPWYAEDTAGGTAGSGHAAPAALTSAGAGRRRCRPCRPGGGRIPTGEDTFGAKRRPGRRGRVRPDRSARRDRQRLAGRRSGRAIRPGAP